MKSYVHLINSLLIDIPVVQWTAMYMVSIMVRFSVWQINEFNCVEIFIRFFIRFCFDQRQNDALRVSL